MRRCLPWLALLWAMLSMPALAQNGWQVQAFSLQLEPRFAERSIQGELRLDFTATQAGLTQLELDAGDLQIAQVRLGEQALAFDKKDKRLRVQLPAGLPKGGAQQLQIRYSGQASTGLRFDELGPQVATAFSTSLWMPCLDDPSVRAPFRLRLLLPAGMLSVGNGSPEAEETQAGGLVAHAWKLEQAVPSYLYGFAAANFTRTQESAGKVTLQYLGPAAQFDSAQLQQVFADSTDMLAFYSERAGVPYPLPVYRQVLLNGPAAQEMAGFAVMGVRYGNRVLQEPQSIWLGAHEMAHQWWGNGVTNQSWRHFWLNEGIASFMTAAYLEHRFGAEEYQRQIAAAGVKYQAVREAGKDKSLVFEDWEHPTAADRSLVYDKGTLVLHELRALLGEDKFWKALKHYTQKHWGQSVVTADFQKAMEEGSGVPLAAFFKQWVFLKD